MSAWRIFRVPLALAIVSAAGLLAALIYDGSIDLLWDAMIAIPIMVIILFWRRRRRA